MRKYLLRSILFSLLLITSKSVWAFNSIDHSDEMVESKSINFVWNSYCPYTCGSVVDKPLGEEKVLGGFAMEVVKAIFDDSPYNVSYKHVDSWNRAMTSVKNGQSDAIVFSFHVENVEQFYILPKLSLASENSTNFLVLKNSNYRITDIDSLKQFNHIGVYKGTVWSDSRVRKFEIAHPEKFTYLHGGKIFDRAIQMLRRGRISAWEDSLAVLNYKIYKFDIKDMRIEKLVTRSSSLGSPLFSKHNPNSKEFARYFSQGLHVLRKSGRLAIILQKYGQQDLLAKQQIFVD